MLLLLVAACYAAIETVREYVPMQAAQTAPPKITVPKMLDGKEMLDRGLLAIEVAFIVTALALVLVFVWNCVASHEWFLRRSARAAAPLSVRLQRAPKRD